MARERMQARGERWGCGRKPAERIAQAHLAPHEVLGLGISEDDPAILG